jgi:hypothetical protein
MQEQFESSDFADDVSTIDSYQLEDPKARGFLPWHLPRKQFVREKQWLFQIVKMLDDRSVSAKTLKYLGLPGTDLIDLRFFHERICVDKNIGLNFLGFNMAATNDNDDQIQLDISLDEVKKLSCVEADSEVVSDDFSMISNEHSMAYKKARAHGPYDVINLDLCDGFAKAEPGTLNGKNFEAVKKILTMQARKPEPWLFLLTTRAGKEHSHDSVMQIFSKIFAENLSKCPDFQKESTVAFDISNEAELTLALDTTKGHLDVFITGLSKWLLRNVVVLSPPTTVELKSVIGYRVIKDSEVEDLVSLALKFEPTFISHADPTNLVKLEQPQLNECQFATPIVHRVSKRVDADKVLGDNIEINKEMSDAMQNLLQQSRYDTSGYPSWVITTLA